MRTSKLCSGGKGISLRHGKQLLRCLPLVGMLFATSSVNATDSPGVKFNSGVRYSQWAINSRLHDFYGNQKKFGFDYYDQNGKRTQEVTWYKLDGKTKVDRSFDYVAGLVGKATLEAADYYENFDWSKSWFYAAQGYATGTPYANTGMTLDNMNAAKMYLPILAGKLHSTDAETVANNAISEVIKHMNRYNTTYSIGGSESALNRTNANDVQKKMLGGWFHKSTEYTDQMWCDGQYMGPALLAQIIKHNNNNKNISDNDWDIVAKQFNITWEQLYDSTTGLLYHGFTANPGDNASSAWTGISKEKGIYHSASFWGRANAWYFLALVDVLEAMPKDNTNYNTLEGYLTTLAAGIKNKQDEKTGCWYQVLDKTSTSLTGNYLEASCSSIFTAAYLKAIRLGLLDKTTYEPVAKNAYEGLVNQFMVYDNTDNNTIQLVKSCTSAGLGGKNNRKGDDDYYLNGTDARVVTSSDISSDYYYTEGKVLGGFIMAATEYERAYQDQDNKKILFAKDLAPTYTINSSADVIDATAYGTDAENAKYQWYKDGKAVADATSAAYTPTESGEYYCTATVGNNTIQTSTTSVTVNAATEGGDNNSGETTTSTLFSMAVNSSASTTITKNNTHKITSSEATIVGGLVTLFNDRSNPWAPYVNGSIKVDNKKNQYIKLSLENELSVNDIINIESNSKYYLTTTATNDNNIATDNGVYTIDASSELKGKKEIYIWWSDSKVGLSTINITRKVSTPKTELTATFDPESVTATVGDASVDVPKLTVTAGKTILLESEYKLSDYTTTNAKVAKVENGKVVFVGEGTTTISVDVTPNNTTLYNRCTAKFTVNVKDKVTPVESTVYDFKSNVGTTTSSNTAIEVTDDNIVFGANYKPREGKYITITPADANVGFKAGDLITITGRSTKGNALMTLNSTLDSKTSEQYQFNALGTTETTYQYLLQADCQVLYLGRASGSTATITGLTVTRAAATNKIRLVATFPSNSITVVKGAGTIELPTLTVKDGETVLTEGYTEDYTVENKSDNPAVATISGDKITIEGIGTTTIFAIITPVDQTKYEGCIATYQVTVKEPTPLAISTMDVTMNTVDAEVKQPIIKVYGDNDKLLTFGTDYKLSYSVDNTNVKVNEKGVFSVDGSAYNWTAGTSKVTVTATPIGDLGKTYKEGTLTFEYNVVKGKITPVFLEAFNGKTINVKNRNSKTFSVPLIYDGEDVSNYFVYTYTINGTAADSKNVEDNTLTFKQTTNGTYTIDVTAKPNTGKEGDDTDDYSEVYNNPVGISFTVKVGDFTCPKVLVDPSSMTMYTGSREEAADVTVMDGKDIMTEDKYKLQWISFTPGVVKVDENGNLEAVSEGTGLVHVVVTGDNLESMSTLLKVFVDDPALYRVKQKDNDNKAVKYGNQRIMWNQDKTMSVSLGGWMFPNNGTGKVAGTTKEDLSSKFKWADDASQAKWKLTGFDNVVLSDDSQNARQENGSNAMPESTDLYNAKFKKQGKGIVDKMFNVPCTGSYLAFNPATNGEVIVHIFQSGAFDHTNEKGYLYRPQRRVFVMDEAGNFVKSSAEIENANGKPKGGVKALGNYKWDLKNDAAPELEEVKKHFPKLPNTFAMSEEGFQNNVMESGLDKSVVPNNVPTNHKDEPGANGWCVLADSPVTYSFRVKAGKTYYLYNFGSKIGFYGYSFEEDATKPTVDEVNYDEASTNTVTATENGHVAKVTINRKFTKGIWTTCVLPFSLNKHQVDAIFGTTYGITNDGTGTTNNNENGTQILYFDRVEGNKAYFVRHAYNTIVAGKPFLIKPAKDVESINTAAVTDYPYVTIENEKPAEWCARNGYAWVSSYSNDMTVQEGDCFISKNDGHFKNFVGDPGTLKGFRGYLKNLSNVAKPQTLSVGMDSNVNEEGTSAIIGLTIDADGNIVTGVADGKVYNVNGQVVSEDSRNFGALPSGVYVINGKKYVK